MKDKISHDTKRNPSMEFLKDKKMLSKDKKKVLSMDNYFYPSILSINTIYICSVVCKIEG